MSQINRRDFLKILGAATLSPLVHASPEERTRARKVFLITLPIAGMYFYDGVEEEVYSELSIGDELELRREPDNLYDENAIEVYTQDGYKLGYVPRVSNPIPASIADQDIAIGAYISEIIRMDEEYPLVRMRLYMVVQAG